MSQKKNEHPTLKRVYTYLPFDIHEKLKEISAKKQILQHEMIRRIVTEYVNKE